MTKETKQRKMKAKEKLALALFMEAVPSIIRIWQERAPEKTFDKFCLDEYEEAKKQKK